MENKIKDNSGDKKYFIVTPRLVWLLARDPYDLSFWDTVKDIAGDEGECRITTKELAMLCMMSVGKVSECRRFWINNGLLNGHREKEPNERNAIWHLIIPDFWEKNIEQSKIYKTIKSRIEFKKKQQIDNKKTVSPHETVTVSPHEKGSSPHEKGSSPHETAYLYREKPLEEPREEPEKNTPARYLFEWDFWKAEQGNKIFEKEFGEKPTFNSKDITAFCRLRNGGKAVSEITERYKKFIATKNSWYAQRGYAFSVFADDYDSFNDKISARRINGKNGNATIGQNEDIPNLAEMTLREFGYATD
jgi:hypothetical protein